MLRLQPGRSYLWLFALYASLFIGGFALCEAIGHPAWGAITLPVFMTFLFLTELRSRVMLDSWWRASYPRRHPRYQTILLFHAFSLVLFDALACLFIQLGS
ncbi:MAG TPA: hypothetical protein VFT74_20785 [Isosphaeraceae bacterium]|nr:hypothetical protein [Isosphaeraceae bacterium]